MGTFARSLRWGRVGGTMHGTRVAIPTAGLRRLCIRSLRHQSAGLARPRREVRSPGCRGGHWAGEGERWENAEGAPGEAGPAAAAPSLSSGEE